MRTFAQVKAEVLDRAKRLELCESYQQALVAEDFPSLILSSVSLVEWTYQAGVVDDDLLQDFPADDLAAAGIYIQPATLVNPLQNIYLFGPGHSVTVDGRYTAKVRVLGTGAATINVAETAYLELKCYDQAQAAVTLADQASATVEGVQASALTLIQADGTALHGRLSDDATATLSGSGTAFTHLRAFNKASVVTSLAGAAELDIKLYQYATQNGQNNL